jgi:hypothetical protein
VINYGQGDPTPTNAQGFLPLETETLRNDRCPGSHEWCAIDHRALHFQDLIIRVSTRHGGNDTQEDENANLLVQDVVEIHTSICRRFVRRRFGEEFVQVVIAFAFILWRDLREPGNPEKSSGMRKRGALMFARY